MSYKDNYKSSFLDNIASVSMFDMVLSLVLAFGIGVFFSSSIRKHIRALCIPPASA